MPDVDSLLESLESDDPREAISQSQALLEEDSDLSDQDRSRLSYGLAAGYFKIGSYVDALEWIDVTNSERRWMLKGFCHMNLQQPQQARESFLEAARKASSNTPEALLLAAQCLATQENYDAALEEFRSLLDRDLPYRMKAEIRFNVGLIYEEREDFTEARNWFRDILEDESGDAFVDEALYHLARLLEDEGKIDRALDLIDRLDDRVEDDSRDDELVKNFRSRLHNTKKDRPDQLREYEL